MALFAGGATTKSECSMRDGSGQEIRLDSLELRKKRIRVRPVKDAFMRMHPYN